MRQDIKKILIECSVIIVALAVIAVIIAASLTNGFTNLKPFENHKGVENTQESVSQDTNTDELDITEGDIVVEQMSSIIEPRVRLSSSPTVVSENCISKTLTATVYPENATNKQVDYSVAWGNAPTHGSEVVTNYVKVTQESDGHNVATVSCYKGFGSDTIIVTVTTRDGGYTAKCTVTFVGIASTMNIGSDAASLTTSTERGEYYLLGTGNTYTFNVGLDNAINEVGSKNLSVKFTAVGDLYFGNAYASSDSGYTSFDQPYTKSLNEFKDRLMTVTISDATITVKVSSTYIENFTGSSEMDEYYTGTNLYDKFVCIDEYDLIGGSGFDYDAIANENQTRLKSCYFNIEVTDSVSGLTQSIRVWAMPSVDAVVLNSSSLQF